MSSTNKTTNFNLPQFLGSDIPSWLTDINPAFLAIDTAMQANKVSASDADAKAESAANSASSASSSAQNAITGVNNLTQAINNWQNLSGSMSIANTSLFENMSNNAIFYNSTLNLLHVRFTLGCKTGTAWNKANNGLINTPLRPSSGRKLINAGWVRMQYGAPLNARINFPVFFQLETNGIISIDDTILSNANTSDAGEIDVSCLLNTVGWGLTIAN